MPDQALGRFWTIPNLLSLSRIALLPLWWHLMASTDPVSHQWGAALIVYGFISDALDGFIARRLNQVSGWGKVLDPVSDKLAAAVIGLFCLFHRGLPPLAWVAATARDLAILVLGWRRYRQSGILPVSANWGRYAALIWGVVLLVYAFDWRDAAGIAVWPAVIVYMLGALSYLGSRNRPVTSI